MTQTDSSNLPQDFSTFEAARLLGLSVRSVQLMADRGELQAWKTPGGHRRISATSVETWRAAGGREDSERDSGASPSPSVLLIDDSMHFQKLVSLLVRQHFPHVTLHVAGDGIGGLALYGKVQPEVLLVDIVLPGIDAVALLTSLSSHPQFACSRVGVITSLDATRLGPYAFALGQVPVVYKPRLVTELPQLLSKWLPPAYEPGDVAAMKSSDSSREPDGQTAA